MSLRSGRPRIALVVDNPYRDLPGLVLTAWKLCQAGAICYLVPMNLLHGEVPTLAPDFILLNFLRRANEALVRLMMDAGIRVGILDTEGSVFELRHGNNQRPSQTFGPNTRPVDTPQWYALTMAQDPAVRRRVSLYCSWSETFAAFARAEGWYEREQLVVTGLPRVDFLAPRWQDAAKRFSSYADEYTPPLILINGSFPLANPKTRQSPQGEVDLMVKMFSYDRDFVLSWQEKERQALHGLTAATNLLARRFPEVTFVYRPHPFEGREIYQRLLDARPNLHLVKRGTVEAWLLRSSALVHWVSSTAVDAGILGVPTFKAAWLEEALPAPTVDAVTTPCPSADVLADHIAAVLAGEFRRPRDIETNLEQVVEATYHRLDGRAHERVAEAICATLRQSWPRTSIEKCRTLAFGGGARGRHWARSAKALLNRAAGLSIHWSFRRMRGVAAESLPWDTDPDKNFRLPDVQAVAEAIGAVAPASAGAVDVLPAQAAGAYHFGYRLGRSIQVSVA